MMHTNRPVSRQPITTLAVLALMLVAGGCGWFGADVVETTGQTTHGESADGGTTGQTDNGESADGGGEVDPPEEAALGPITDPAESEDPDASTPDTAPQTTSQRIRAGIQAPLEQEEWLLADQRAAEALERTDLEPEFRLELEAYRDLARAADAGDEVAAGNAIERLERFEPEFVQNLAVRQVLPVEPTTAAGLTGETAEGEGTVGEEPTEERTAADSTTAAKFDEVTTAVVTENWDLAGRLAGELLSDGAMTSEDTARARIYGDLAEAHINSDADAIARATESLASLDPDLARRLDRGSLIVDPGDLSRSDG